MKIDLTKYQCVINGNIVKVSDMTKAQAQYSLAVAINLIESLDSHTDSMTWLIKAWRDGRLHRNVYTDNKKTEY